MFAHIYVRVRMREPPIDDLSGQLHIFQESMSHLNNFFPNGHYHSSIIDNVHHYTIKIHTQFYDNDNGCVYLHADREKNIHAENCQNKQIFI